MHSHLIVMTFEGKGEASGVYDALQQMRGSPLLGLENAAIVTKDSHGRFSITRKRELPCAGKESRHDLAGSAITLLFGDPPDEMLDALAKEGVDDKFREQVLQAMDDGSSALIFLVMRDSDVDRSRLREILTLFKGAVFETTLPRSAEEVLAKGW